MFAVEMYARVRRACMVEDERSGSLTGCSVCTGEVTVRKIAGLLGTARVTGARTHPAVPSLALHRGD